MLNGIVPRVGTDGEICPGFVYGDSLGVERVQRFPRAKGNSTGFNVGQSGPQFFQPHLEIDNGAPEVSDVPWRWGA